MDLIAEFFPKVMCGTAGPIAAASDRRARSTACCTDRLIYGKNDVGNASLGAVMRQKVAAARTAHALDEPALAQEREELLKVGERDLLPLGNLRERDRSASAMLCEIDHSHHRIAAFGAQPHRVSLRLRAPHRRSHCPAAHRATVRRN